MYRINIHTRQITSPLIILVSFILLFCVPEDRFYSDDLFFSERTKKSNRDLFQRNLIAEIETNLQSALTDSTEQIWQSAFWGMGLLNYHSETTDSAVREGLNQFGIRSHTFQRAILEIVYQLYPDIFMNRIMSIAEKTDNPKIFAMSAIYLIHGDKIAPATRLIGLMYNRFPDWKVNPILFMLNFDLHELIYRKSPGIPNLQDLFSHTFQENAAIIYSIHRKNRSWPGLAVFKRPDGKFLRESDGSFTAVPHLARSASNLPAYLTNGNSPQGVFIIIKTGYSENVFIGPSPTLELKMPFETNVKNFFKSERNNPAEWSKELYQSLLPESWGEYVPVYQAYYAGMAGRTEIIAHGTTINPEYYSNEPYYPGTPSLGCITANELWDPKSGQCLMSDQIKIVNHWLSLNAKHGYLILVEIDDREFPVLLKDILMYLENTEKNSH